MEESMKRDLQSKIADATKRLSVPKGILKKTVAKPLLFIDIDIGDGKKDRITVYD
jgi:hypothetical protein